MPAVTASLPPVGLSAYFVFKDPAADYVRSRLTLSDTKIGLEITSITSMAEMRSFDLRDPYQVVYLPLGLTESDFEEDYRNKVPILTFKHTSLQSVVTYLRIPLNYLQSYSETLDITYMNKCIVIDMGKLPTALDSTVIFSELTDVIRRYLGVNADMKEVSVGEVDVIDQASHDMLETIRQNAITVRKPLSVQLEEVSLAHSQLLGRIQSLGITLG